MLSEHLKKAVARTTAVPKGLDPITGTAFLISSKLLLTCRHCLGDDPTNLAQEITVVFPQWGVEEQEKTFQATPVWIHPNWYIDLALIELCSDLTEMSAARGLSPISLAHPNTPYPAEAAWSSFGYPVELG